MITSADIWRSRWRCVKARIRSALAHPWVQHAAIGVLGIALGVSCPYWPIPIRPVCESVSSLLGHHVQRAAEEGAEELVRPVGVPDAGT